ncbi:hypothetical protein TNCV_2201811 [Trichonephila clavipes]|uniref:Uncharacterized protein n=1 Tax=Trichonephila clavipes TaxID=2585209 RepID=A0A8X6UVH4_TRICX|nr:hypothetical protein TNCV_2201811 [Trichonephila clavipes]
MKRSLIQMTMKNRKIASIVSVQEQRSLTQTFLDQKELEKYLENPRYIRKEKKNMSVTISKKLLTAQGEASDVRTPKRIKCKECGLKKDRNVHQER